MDLSERYHTDPYQYNQDSMPWKIIREMSENKLVEIGAHTVHHLPLRKLPLKKVVEEAGDSREVIMQHIGYAPKHFSYPFGDMESAGPREFQVIKRLGFDTATTMRKGVIFPEHAQHLHALPRVALNGDFQNLKYVKVFLSGAPFALLKKFRRLDVSG
jgi:peptidoglycan/xylan/chitin deacetylase (PgdA/CDA1 family)